MNTKQDLLKELLKQYEGDFKSLVADIKHQVQTTSLQAERPKQPVGPVIASLEGVAKSYKTGGGLVQAVKDATFDIHEGEIVALIGPSGSGKSTILNLLGGLDKPTTGIVRVGGKSLGSMSDGELSKFRNETIGFVFQFFYLQPFLSLKTNVEIPMMFGRQSKNARHEKSSELINAVGLDDRAEHRPKELSGGQIQRTAIARALVNSPKLVLADEPTGNLDRANGDQIMDLFEKIRQESKTAILIVTHDEKTAARADRIITVDDGVAK